MGRLVAGFKFAIVLTIIGSYFVVAAPLYPFIKYYPYKIKKLLSHLCGLFSRMVLFVLGVKVSLAGLENFDREKNYFIVSNHLSYLDMLIFLANFPSNFVTSMEVKETPVLGPISQLAGSLYVERRNKRNILSEIKEIEDALSNGLNVTVFPEATSTNGEQVLGFKRSLFQSAINTKLPVLPLTLNYLKVDEESLSRKNRDKVCWYGDMGFAPHLWELCHCSSVEALLTFSHPVEVRDNFDCSAKLRDICYQTVSNNYVAFV